MSDHYKGTICVAVALADEAEDWHLGSDALATPTDPIWVSVCKAAGWDQVAPANIILMAMAVIAGRNNPNPRDPREA